MILSFKIMNVTITKYNFRMNDIVFQILRNYRENSTIFYKMQIN